jgi:hypothetical protein
VGACLSGNLYAVYNSNGMIELVARLLEATFDRAPAGGHLSMRGEDELHHLRYEWKEVISSAMFSLTTAKRHAARRGQTRGDFARVHPLAALHDRRTKKHG